MTGASLTSRVSCRMAGLTSWCSAGSVRVRDSRQRAGEAAEAGHPAIESPYIVPTPVTRREHEFRHDDVMSHNLDLLSSHARSEETCDENACGIEQRSQAGSLCALGQARADSLALLIRSSFDFVECDALSDLW